MSTANLEAPASPIRFMPAHQIMSSAPVLPLKTLCSTCQVRDLCLPCGMTDSDIERLDRLMFDLRKVKSGQALYREGDHFRFIYAVRCGTFKSSIKVPDGREQVSDFHMAGELMGLDGVAHGEHASTATALEDSEVCAIPYVQISDLAAASSGMEHLANRLMCSEIMRERSLIMLLGRMSAEERLAAFLLNLSQRLKERGYSSREFHLRMTRTDIGSYLGIHLATVCRTFSALQQQHLLEVEKRHIRIIDLDGLTRAFEMRVH